MKGWRRWGPSIGGFVIAALYLWVLPEALGSMNAIPAPIQTLMNGAIFAFLLLNFLVFVIVATGLPSSVESEPAPTYQPKQKARKQQQALKREGLVPQVPLKTTMGGGIHLLVLDSAEKDMAAVVFDIGVMVGTDLVSHFEGGYFLFTGDKRDGGTLPQHPRDLRQLLPGANAGGLVMAHRRGIAYLEREGLKLKPITSDDIPQAINDYQVRARAVFFDHLYKNTLISTGRTLSRLNPYLKPIHEQKLDLRKHL